MDASLDTNVIIHLYTANLQTILFNRFERLTVYEYIRNQEMEKHAEPEIKEMFDRDVELGKIQLITNTYIRELGMYNIFQYHVQDIKILFDGSDLGEVYAIAMAKTLGCISLVTDDIKERGPHYTLMRMHDSDVLPFAFYELLFLDYIEEKLTEKELLDNFNTVCYHSNLTINLLSKLKAFIKRFWSSPYRDSEKEWMKLFCSKNSIDAKFKMQNLYMYLNKQ